MRPFGARAPCYALSGIRLRCASLHYAGTLCASVGFAHICFSRKKVDWQGSALKNSPRGKFEGSGTRRKPAPCPSIQDVNVKVLRPTSIPIAKIFAGSEGRGVVKCVCAAVDGAIISTTIARIPCKSAMRRIAARIHNTGKRVDLHAHVFLDRRSKPKNKMKWGIGSAFDLKLHNVWIIFTTGRIIAGGASP